MENGLEGRRGYVSTGNSTDNEFRWVFLKSEYGGGGDSFFCNHSHCVLWNDKLSQFLQQGSSLNRWCGRAKNQYYFQPRRREVGLADRRAIE